MNRYTTPRKQVEHSIFIHLITDVEKDIISYSQKNFSPPLPKKLPIWSCRWEIQLQSMINFASTIS